MKPTVELVKSSYQPSKAELEEDIELRKPDGSRPTPKEVAQAVLRNVNIKWRDKP